MLSSLQEGRPRARWAQLRVTAKRHQSQRLQKLSLPAAAMGFLPNARSNPTHGKERFSKRAPRPRARYAQLRALPLQAVVQTPTRLQVRVLATCSTKTEAASKSPAQLVVAAPLLVDERERISRLALSSEASLCLLFRLVPSAPHTIGLVLVYMYVSIYGREKLAVPLH